MDPASRHTRKPRSATFRGRVFLILLATAMVPSALLLGGGVWLLSDMVGRTGTAGPWDAVAESGRTLLERLDESGATANDPVLASVAAEHRRALSESVRLSRVYEVLSGRVLGRVPWLALGVAGLIAILSLMAARTLARGITRPVAELVGWTERIAEGAPLPAEDLRRPGQEPREFGNLRTALRSMERELARGRERAVEAARLRTWSELARRVAHDLKNPLTPMKIAVHQIEAGRAGPGSEAVRVLSDEMNRLDDMARSFARLGRAPEEPRSSVDVGELLADLAARMSTGGVSVRVERAGGVAPAPVRAHLEALRGAFQNLIANAVEAAGPGGDEPGPDGSDGWVTIHIGADATHVTVRLRDSGPGIEPELLDRVWEPDVTSKRSGTGLGLPIVRHTVRLHGGSVSARNPADGGAEFVVVLPREGADDAS